jgi:hypothetical protein
MEHAVRHCVLCRSDDISTTHEAPRIVTATCRTCGAVIRVEFDPPDEPWLRGVIEIIEEPWNRKSEVRH